MFASDSRALAVCHLFILLVPCAPAIADVQRDIAWMADQGPPAQEWCRLFPVTGDSVENRGRTSGNGCIAKALRAALTGHNEKALGWLAAGQCHNSNATDAIRNNPFQSLDYLTKNFVAVFEHQNFDGNEQALKVGVKYRAADLSPGSGLLQGYGVGNDTISSILVPVGIKVRVCIDEGPPGGNGANQCQDIGPGNHNLTGVWNDSISFLEARRSD